MTVAEILEAPERVAAIMADVARKEIMPRFRKLADHEIDQKASGEIFTAADIAAEAGLSEALQAELPESVIVGEEGAAADPGLLDHLEGDAPVWVIDPVDGTKNFAAGKECFTVIVALCQHQRTLAGWIHDPVRGVTAYAVQGQGAWLAGERLAVAPQRAIPEMTGSLGPRRRKRLEELAARGEREMPKRVVRLNCAGMEYLQLATGDLDFVEFYSLKPWDHAAGVLLHAEAGGFSAETEARMPYAPKPHYRARLLMAAGPESWERLRETLLID